jgi:hypothetical protein
VTDFATSTAASSPFAIKVAQTIRFTVYDGSGAQLGLTTAAAPARTAVQVSNIFNVIGLGSDVSHAYCVVEGDQNLPLLAYAGVIDNQSQDLAFVQGQPSSLPTPGRVTIPVSASIHGAGGSFFHTDATALNTAISASANITLRYRCFSGSCGNATQTVTLAPREMRAFDDLIANVFSAPESGGAIQFDSDQPIVVNSRLYTPSRPAPTNGMGVPGLAEAGAPVTAILTSLSHSANPSAGFRTNVGAYNSNDVAQMITFTLYDPAGTPLGLGQRASTHLCPGEQCLCRRGLHRRRPGCLLHRARRSESSADRLCRRHRQPVAGPRVHQRGKRLAPLGRGNEGHCVVRSSTGMARPLRFEYPGAVYHVMTRSHERSDPKCFRNSLSSVASLGKCTIS